MFCPTCGTQWPDDTRFCGTCGANMQSAEPVYAPPAPEAPVFAPPTQQSDSPEDATMVVNPAPYFEEQPAPAYDQAPVYEQQPVYTQAPVYEQQPVYTPSYEPAPAYQPPAAPKAKPQGNKAAIATLVLVAMLASLAVIVLSAILTLTTPINELPLVTFVMDMADEDLDEDLRELDELYDQAKDSYNEQKDSMSADERELAREALELIEEVSDSLSILNFSKLVDFIQGDYTEFAEDNGLDLEMDEDEIDEIVQIRTVVMAALLGIHALPLLFALLGGLCKSKGLTVVAIIFSILPILAFSGIIWFIVSQVALITQAVACGKHRKLRNA